LPEVKLCGPEEADVVHKLTQAAFNAYVGFLDPPSGVTRETLEFVRQDLEQLGGAIAWAGNDAVGCLRFDIQPAHLHVRRVAVDPGHQRQGVGRALMDWSHSYARSLGLPEVRLGVRGQLRGNRVFYERLGYTLLAEHRHPDLGRVWWYEMRLVLDKGMRHSGPDGRIPHAG
jgi:GNAT superfamily N-acetyltransferase